MSTNVNNLPSDKTPAQRAQLKLYEQFGLIFLVNAALAAYVLLSSYGTGQRPNWAIVIIAAVAQGVIASFNVAEKYFSAKNEPLYSAFVEAGRQEVLAKAPPVPYSATDQALLQAANAAFTPTYTYNVPVLPQSAAVQSSLRPVALQTIPADNTPVQPVSVPNVPPADAVLSGTIPAMPVVMPPSA